MKNKKPSSVLFSGAYNEVMGENGTGRRCDRLGRDLVPQTTVSPNQKSEGALQVLPIHVGDQRAVGGRPHTSKPARERPLGGQEIQEMKE